MTKTITSHTLQLVTFTTTVPFSEVVSRLDKEIAKGPTPGMAAVAGATTKEDVQKRVESAVGPSGFLYFNEFNHGKWLQIFTTSPGLVVYVVGNPLLAQTVLQHDLRAAYNIPPRLLIIEKADGTGTDVVYHLPSSVMALGDNETLKAAAEAIDGKFEALVERITAVE
ncbi:hypothetical protein C8F04DRAFT_7683 [Mycena alexandri]|uniref:DUF302 domain-containing protein n=1 Tax=Mycena alexandri TaxID=1745969 RepID=A0AAD6TJC6_9AGAR|nr:hypothetical protein C8F04DRAFT_7683 [Mycena alexandri]